MQSAFCFYVGVDWATQTHRVCVMDAKGEIVRQQSIEHSGEAIRAWLQSLQELTPDPQQVAIAIEVPRGPLVEAFLECKYAVFAINPKQLDRFRDRYSVAGAKDDKRDALVLADSLRTDQHCFRAVALDAPEVIRLRELTRTEETIAADLRHTANQLYQLLLRYYAQILELCAFPDEAGLWALLEAAPTPQRAAKLTATRLSNLLARHRIHRWNADQIREVLSRPPLPVAPGVEDAVRAFRRMQFRISTGALSFPPMLAPSLLVRQRIDMSIGKPGGDALEYRVGTTEGEATGAGVAGLALGSR